MSAPPGTMELDKDRSGGMDLLKAVSIALIGISIEERQQLLDVFSMIPNGRLVYTLVPLTLRPDILIVNADAPKALAMWVRYRNYIRQLGAVPASIVVSRHRTFDTAHYQLRGPLNSGEALAMLDRVATEKLGLGEALLTTPAAIPPLRLATVTGTPLQGRSDADSQPADGLAATALPSSRLAETALGSLAATALPSHLRGGAPDGLSITTTRNPLISTHDRIAPTVHALVVDDSLPVRIQMRQALQPLSWHVDFAENGEQALDMLCKHRYDIIFLDVVLPGIDGYETCRRAKAGNATDTPIIMLTSASSPADRVKGKLAGCNTYLIKPVTPPVLRQLIEQYVNVK